MFNVLTLTRSTIIRRVKSHVVINSRDRMALVNNMSRPRRLMMIGHAARYIIGNQLLSNMKGLTKGSRKSILYHRFLIFC